MRSGALPVAFDVVRNDLDEPIRLVPVYAAQALTGQLVNPESHQNP